MVDENGEYVAKSAIEHRVQFAYGFENPEASDEKVVYCGYLINHWGHFLIKAVARLWYFLENDLTVDKYVFFVGYNEHREIKGNYREFFELLGIWDKIEIINKPTKYRQVIVPELGYKRIRYYSDGHKNIFNAVAQNVKPQAAWQTKERIFLSRSQIANVGKNDFGIEMLDYYFSKNGYEIVSPEKISLSYLFFLIRNAEICAAHSGTLPHNILFGKDGQKLVLVERDTRVNDFQIEIDSMKSKEVIYIDANIAIYPVTTGGPFLIAYPGKLEQFTKDNNLNPPNSKFYSKAI